MCRHSGLLLQSRTILKVSRYWNKFVCLFFLAESAAQQSEKTSMFFWTRRASTRYFTVDVAWPYIQIKVLLALQGKGAAKLKTKYRELQACRFSIALKALCGLKSPKGQLISECLLIILNFPKKQQKISALEYKKWSNQQNKGTLLSYLI